MDSVYKTQNIPKSKGWNGGWVYMNWGEVIKANFD